MFPWVICSRLGCRHPLRFCPSAFSGSQPASQSDSSFLNTKGVFVTMADVGPGDFRAPIRKWRWAGQQSKRQASLFCLEPCRPSALRPLHACSRRPAHPICFSLHLTGRLPWVGTPASGPWSRWLAGLSVSCSFSGGSLGPAQLQCHGPPPRGQVHPLEGVGGLPSYLHSLGSASAAQTKLGPQTSTCQGRRKSGD